MTQNKKNPGRVTDDDLASCIYSPDDNRKVGLTPYERKQAADKEQTVYTILGKHHGYDDNKYPVLFDVRYEDGQIEHAEDSSDAFAKVSSFRGQTKYYIKTGSGGALYNPIGLYEGAGKDTNAIKMGRHQFNWTQVNSKCFGFYLEFLRTKNRRYIVNAQREVM